MRSRTSRAAARAAMVLVVLAVATSVTLAPALAAKTKTSKPSKSSGKAVPESLQVLVRVGGQAITRADVQRRLEELPEQYRGSYSTPEGKQQLLDRMVEEKVWVVEAQRAGVPARPQVQRQIEQQKRDLVIRTYLTEVMAESPAPTDSQAYAYYQAHISDYRVPATLTLRHLQVKTEAEAKKVLALARNPKEDWNKLVLKYTVDSLTRANGGLVGTITREGSIGSMGPQPALAETAFAMTEGRVGGPVRSDRGWHLLKVESIRPESVRPFEQVKPTIQRQLSSAASQDYYKLRLDEARKSLGVTPDSAAIKSFVSQKKTAREQFKEAQEAGPAAQRILLYEKLLADYPDADVSPQAQFMVGFINSEELKNYEAAEKAFKTLLQKYPKSELTASAQWMLDHMRSEDAPPFLGAGTDSASALRAPAKGSKPKP